MKALGYIVVMLVLLTGCGSNQDYRAEVQAQANDIIEKVKYDGRKLQAMEQNHKPPLEIRDETINIVQSVITQDRRIEDVLIEADSNNVYISILVDDKVSNEESKEIGEMAAQQLSSFAEGVQHRNTNQLGELYDFYNLVILIGDNRATPSISGVKAPVETSINWQI